MHSDRYFLSAWADFTLLGGASLVAWAVLTLTGWDPQGVQMAVAAAWISWVVNWPHFSATLNRLAASPASRSEFPLTVFVVPVLVILAVAGSFAAPIAFAPFFIKLYLIWSPYHFSGQTVGITLIGARRQGVTLTARGRQYLSAFVFGTFAYGTLEAEVFPQGAKFYGVEYPGLGVPPELVTLAFWAMAAAGVLFLAELAKSARGRWGRLPMVLLPVAAQFAWFVLGRKNLAFYVLVPAFHSLQYLPVAWAMGMADRKERGELATPSDLLKESGYWYGVNLMGGIALFHLLPRLVSRTGIPLELATGVILAGIQIHHFFVDGVVWKLKSSRVSAALTRNVRNLVGEAA